MIGISELPTVAQWHTPHATVAYSDSIGWQSSTVIGTTHGNSITGTQHTLSLNNSPTVSARVLVEVARVLVEVARVLVEVARVRSKFWPLWT